MLSFISCSPSVIVFRTFGEVFFCFIPSISIDAPFGIDDMKNVPVFTKPLFADHR